MRILMSKKMRFRFFKVFILETIKGFDCLLGLFSSFEKKKKKKSNFMLWWSLQRQMHLIFSLNHRTANARLHERVRREEEAVRGFCLFVLTAWLMAEVPDGSKPSSLFARAFISFHSVSDPVLFPADCVQFWGDYWRRPMSAFPCPPASPESTSAQPQMAPLQTALRPRS